MNRFYTRFTLAIAVLFQLSTSVIAGTLDDYYLQQFGEVKTGQLQKALLSTATVTQEAAKCGMPLKHSLRRDWKLLEASTQKVLAKQLANPTLSGTEQTVTSSGGHFLIHYTSTGSDAPDIPAINLHTGLGLGTATDWANKVADTFEYVYNQYGTMGYQLAPTSSGKYDIYLHSLASQGYYGVTNSSQFTNSTTFPDGVTSWMELDSSFTDSIFKPYTYSPLQSLQITAAHEYHHAIQYGYTIYFDVWYAEATSTWMEDELYDGVNQSYNYIPAWFNNSTAPLDLSVGTDAVTSGAGYGRWIFNRYLSEKHGSTVVRSAWEKIGGISSPSGSDIPMLPVLENLLSSTTYNTSLSTDFFGFAKRVYTRDWTSHTNETGKIHPYSPTATLSLYQAGSSVSSITPSITLPHYSFAYYTLTPTPGVTSLTISISKDSGIQTALFKNGSEISADASGTSYSTSSLATTDNVILLIANSSSTDSRTASFSSDGKLILTSGTANPAPATSSSTGNGCFIATAAYGSYLHPQVQLLRNFRDNYLLTNAPGRAFVALYYRCSPPLADVIASYPFLRGVTRLLLTPLVVIIAYPLVSIFCLLLVGVILLKSRLRRSRFAGYNTQPHTIRTTFYRR